MPMFFTYKVVFRNNKTSFQYTKGDVVKYNNIIKCKVIAI